MIAYQPLLDSERVLVQQQDTLAEGRGLVGIDLVAVYKALGGGWQVQQMTTPPQTPSVPVPASEPTSTP